MIRIMSRRVFRFYNPSQPLVMNRENQDGNVVQELAIPAAVTVGRDKLHTDLFFDTVPGDVQEAPDWIKAKTGDMMNFNTFKRAVDAGMLTELGDISDPFTRHHAATAVPLSEAPISLAKDQEKITVGSVATPVIDSSKLLDETPQAAPAPARPLAGGKAKRAS
jgi:hypothetical protein